MNARKLALLVAFGSVLHASACGDDDGQNPEDSDPDAVTPPAVLTFDPAMITGQPSRDAGSRPITGGDGDAPRDAGRSDDAGDDELPDPEQPTNYRCAGVATSCSALGSASCGSALGCRWEGDCTGYAPSCYGQLSSYSCNGIDGCYWSSSADSCSGSSWSCPSYFSSLSCTGQKGCYWDEACEGISTSCLGLGQASCLTQPGCRWEHY